jgi:hypothetical protein
VNDYNHAVAAYRKTFPSKQMVMEQTPDLAVREMLLHMQDLGYETTLTGLTLRSPIAHSASLVSVAKPAPWVPAGLQRNLPEAPVAPTPTSLLRETC